MLVGIVSFFAMFIYARRYPREVRMAGDLFTGIVVMCGAGLILDLFLDPMFRNARLIIFVVGFALPYEAFTLHGL